MITMIIVTTGAAFCDMDGLACTVAYKELLEKTGQPATVLISGPLNYSTGNMAEGLDYETVCPEGENNFVVVDISNPDRFPKEAKLENVVEIFDHHFGFENFWKERLGEKSHIEKIGACATLIWEAYKKAGLEKEISTQSATLLAVAIFENSTNLNPAIAIPRDEQAFKELLTLSDLPADWQEKYYEACTKIVLADLKTALINDTKIENLPGSDETLAIGQLGLRQPKQLLLENKEKIKQILQPMGTHWMMQVLDISLNKDYIFTDDLAVQKFIEKTLSVSFVDNIATTEHIVLRKMIIKGLVGWTNG